MKIHSKQKHVEKKEKNKNVEKGKSIDIPSNPMKSIALGIYFVERLEKNLNPANYVFILVAIITLEQNM